MFKIYDGRKEFYQWDLDRKLIVEDKTISEVHFCNRMGAVSVIRYVYEVNGLYLVDVPNLLLQDSFRMNVYGYDKNYTKHSKNFNIVARTRPENYVFTDDEIATWDELDERINNIEKEAVPEAVIEAVVQDYLKENPAVDLSGYATEEYVDNAVGAIEIPEVDLSNHYTKEETRNLIEADLAYYATKTYVDQKIAEAELGGEDVDLSGYYTKEETDTAISNADALLREDIIDVMTNNYIHKNILETRFQVIEENHYTKEETDKAIKDAVDAIEIPEAEEVDLSNYYTKSEVDGAIEGAIGAIQVPTNISAFTNDAGYQTETQVNSLINAALGVIENGSY